MGVATETGTDRLLPLTKVVLVVSAIVQLVVGLDMVIDPSSGKRFLWTAPLPNWPREAIYFFAAAYLAAATSAAFALYQDRWTGSKVYFAYSFPYIVFSQIAVILAALHSGVPAIMWACVLLSLLYLPAVAYCWRRQESG